MSRIESGRLEKESTALGKIQSMIEKKEACNTLECDILILCNEAIGESLVYHPERIKQ